MAQVGSMATTPAPHFRFLGLPQELRLTLYDFLPTKIVHYDLDLDADAIIDTAEAPISLQLVWKIHCGTALLSTCRTIYQEVYDHLRKPMAAIKDEPIRLILSPRAHKTSRTRDLLDCLMLSHQNCSENEGVRNLLHTKHFSHGQ